MADGNDLAAVVEWLDATTETPVTALLERLLDWGRVHHDETERAFRAASADEVRVMAASIASELPADTSARLYATEVRGVASWLHDVAMRRDGEARALAVRVLAKHFDDEGRARNVIGQLTAAGPVVLGPGRVVPRMTPFGTLKAMYGSRLATRPSTLASRAELTFFAHLPRELPYGLRVRVHGGWDAIDELDADTLLGCGIPWCASELGATEVEETSLIRRRNVARVVARGGMRGQQEKIVGAMIAGRLEAIEPEQPILEMFFGGAWSLAVVICRDYIDSKIATLLEDLRPGLVLVPAMSPKTADFDAQAIRHASAQAHVVIANACAPSAEHDPFVVLAVRPTTQPPEVRASRVARNEVRSLPFGWVGPLSGPQKP